MPARHPIRFAASLAVIALIALPAGGQPTAPTPPATPPAKVAVCTACHGQNGNSTDPQYPILAGQSWRYLYIQLRDFNEGRRKDPQMSPMAAELTKDEMMALANWYAAQRELPNGFKADGAKVVAGQKKSDEVLCQMCHLGGFAGQNEIPRVAGQHYQYIVKQLKDFKAKTRTNDAGNMTSVASTLSDQDIDNLANYIANLQ
jgi:cytochrome c553